MAWRRSSARPSKTAESIHALWKIVADQAEDWGYGENEQNRPWYRGHASLGWKLRPSSLRGRNWNTEICDNENESIEEFLTKAPGLGVAATAPLGLWDGYFLMQHHCVPTRLLDWTESVLVAAYFAVDEKRGDGDAAIWMLDPYELNKSNPSFGKSVVVSPGFVGNKRSENRKVNQWLPICGAGKFSSVPEYPLAVYPAYLSRRIENQKAAFTIHGSRPDGLEELWRGGGPVLRIVIPGSKAREFRAVLRDLGVNTATVYPDAEGLGRYLAERWWPVKVRAPHQAVYTRLKPSKVHKGGVGVFAIRPIPKGTNIFAGECESIVWTDKSELPKNMELKALYTDFGVLRDGRYATPASFNSIGPGWYLNHSKSPNVKCNEDLDFIALRDIKVDEELTANYDEYSERSPGTSLPIREH